MIGLNLPVWTCAVAVLAILGGGAIMIARMGNEPRTWTGTTARSSERPKGAEGRVQQQHHETVEVSGHLMDSGVLARVLDDVLEYGGDYVIDTHGRRQDP